MKRQIFVHFIVIVCLVWLSFLPRSGIAAGVPDEIAFQGRLLDDSGVPIPEGSKSMYFQIFDVETGGTALWSENQQVQVGPDGYYTAYLGRKNPITLPFDQAYWLQVKVEDDPAMTPRFPFKKVAYAFRADEAAAVSDLSVTTSNIVNQAVTAIKIAANAVTSAKISDGSIVDSDISATAAISPNKIDDGPGSGLDADTVDGQHASAFAPTSHDHFGDSWSGSEEAGLEISTSHTSGKAMYGSASSSTGFAVGGHFETASVGGAAVYGYGTAASGPAMGGFFRTDSESGFGVSGYATSTSGPATGGFFSTNSTSGMGVYGYAPASTGSAYGGFFKANSPSGIGLYAEAPDKAVSGHATDTSGSSYGGYFESDSSDGTGVYTRAPFMGIDARSTRSTGIAYGIYSHCTSTAGTGAYGGAGAGTGTTYGGRFENASTSGTGAYGCAFAPSGDTYGGYFKSNSTSGTGVYGYAYAFSGTTYGGYFHNNSTGGYAIYAHATNSSGATHGGYFKSNSTSGYGVYGIATASSGIATGGLFSSSSTSGYGVKGFATAGSGTTYGVYGSVNSADGYAGYFSGGRGVYVNGNLSCTGTKPFVQQHPTDPSKEIVYTAVEAPEARTSIRGTAELVNGKAEIELPEHFGLVTSAERLTVTLTPVGQWLQLYVVEKAPGRLFVREASGKSGQFDYLVQGIRKGYEDYQVIREKHPQPDPEPAVKPNSRIDM